MSPDLIGRFTRRVLQHLNVLMVSGWLATMPLRAAAQVPSCIGDCNGDGQVTVDEIVTLANIALGKDHVESCEAGDADADARITVDELIAAVNDDLKGCPSGTLLGGRRAVKAASRVALATMQSIEIMDFGYVGAQPGQSAASAFSRFRLAGTARGAISHGSGAGPAVPDTLCDNAVPAVTCTVDAGASTLTVVYAQCQTTAAGHTIVRDGTVTETVGDAGFCDSRIIPPTASMTLQLENFTLNETDASGNHLASIVTTITDAFTPAGGCTAANGQSLINSTEVIDGTELVSCAPLAKSIRCPGGGVNLGVTAHGLTIERNGKGTPCQLTVSTQGGLDIEDQATGERFSQTLSSTRLTETAGSDQSTMVSIDGALSVDCLGALDFQTNAPLLLQPRTKCPASGSLQVEFPMQLAGAGSSVASGGGGRTELGQIDALVSPVSGTAGGTQRNLAEGAGSAGVALNAEGHETVFRAANGPVYQVLQNVPAVPMSPGSPFGAKDIRITTVVGSTTDAPLCTSPTTGTNMEPQIFGAASSKPFDPSHVFKSALINDATAPCFNPDANGGHGRVCVGPDCEPTACTCPDGAACTTFSKDEGTVLTTRTDDVPAATLADAGCEPGKTYSFGTSDPTTATVQCQSEPKDGFLLPGTPSVHAPRGTTGTTLILVYDVPFGVRFLTAFAGLPISRDTNNSFECDANQVLLPGTDGFDLKLPPVVTFSTAGVKFDLRVDGAPLDSAPTCEDPTLLLCVPPPAPTPTPNPSCNPLNLGTQKIVHQSGSTMGGGNAFGGASCGSGGNQAPDFGFAYKAPMAGFYTIDTLGSDFDTVLYVRDGRCDGPELACNDDVDLTTPQSQVGVTLTEGQRVVIVVDGFGTASGHFELNINYAGATAPTPTPTPTSPPVVQLPDLVVTSVTGPMMATAGAQISVSATVMNQGVTAAGAFALEFLFSSDAVIDTSDIDTGFGCAFSGLAAGASVQCSGPINVPASLQPGTYSLGAFADFTNQVTESNEDNNGRAADLGQIVINASANTPTATPTQTGTNTPTSSATQTPKPTSTPTNTRTPSSTSTATNSPTAGPTPACCGDCNGDNNVTLGELSTCMSILNGASLSTCPECDCNGNGRVDIDDLTKIEANANFGCPAPPTATPTSTASQTPTPTLGLAVCGNGIVEHGEDCDGGGICIGNAKAGQACTSDAACCATANCSGPTDGGVCEAGPKLGAACTTNAACPDSRCVRCKTFGGNGCAANCTTETPFVFNLFPGQVDPNTGVTLVAGTTGAVIHGEVLTLPLPISNSCQGGANPGAPCTTNADCGTGVCSPATQTFVVGKPGADGIVPFVVRAASVHFPRIDVGGLSCACIRGVAQQTCGGTIFDADGVTQTTSCTANFGVCDGTKHCANAPTVGCTTNTDCDGDAVCMKTNGLPCALVHGAGNSASGFAGCGSAGLPAVNVNETQDAGGCADPPSCTRRTPKPPVITLATMGPPGSAIVLNTTAIGAAVGSCTGNDPTVYGPDGVFCTADDPQASRGTPQTIRLTTGQACASISNANFSTNPPINITGICQGSPGSTCAVSTDCGTSGPCIPICAAGTPFNCSALASHLFPGGALAGAFVSLSNPTIGDVVITNQFFSMQ